MMTIKKNDCFIVEIEDMSEDGSGIGKHFVTLANGDRDSYICNEIAP